MATLAVTQISRAGLALSLAAAAVGGDVMPNTGKEMLVIKNGSGSPMTVSAAITRKVDNVTPATKDLVVAAGATALFGPFAKVDYNNASDQVAFTYSSVTTVTVQAVQLIPE